MCPVFNVPLIICSPVTYVPRDLCSPMFPHVPMFPYVPPCPYVHVFYVTSCPNFARCIQCTTGSMFPVLYVASCSMFPRALCSPGPKFPWYYVPPVPMFPPWPMFPVFYVPLCSMFPRALCSQRPKSPGPYVPSWPIFPHVLCSIVSYVPVFDVTSCPNFAGCCVPPVSNVPLICRFSTKTFWRLVFSHEWVRIHLQIDEVELEINSETRVWEHQSPKCWVGELCSLPPHYCEISVI